MLQFPTLENPSRRIPRLGRAGGHWMDVEQNNKSTHSLAGGDLDGANFVSLFHGAPDRR